MTTDRLTQQIQFILEIDRLKQVLRQTMLIDRSRQENSAEHTWQLAVMALVLVEYANEPVDPMRVIKMLLIHDIIEIDAGDTFAYDQQGHQDKAAREQRAAERLFGLLPPDQKAELRALWDEFEEQQTPEARFAAALDRFQPMLHNFHTEGHSWRKHDVSAAQVLARCETITAGSERLGQQAEAMVRDAVKQGFLRP